jgi:hypothetical protein
MDVREQVQQESGPLYPISLGRRTPSRVDHFWLVPWPDQTLRYGHIRRGKYSIAYSTLLHNLYSRLAGSVI